MPCLRPGPLRLQAPRPLQRTGRPTGTHLRLTASTGNHSGCVATCSRQAYAEAATVVKHWRARHAGLSGSTRKGAWDRIRRSAGTWNLRLGRRWMSATWIAGRYRPQARWRPTADFRPSTSLRRRIPGWSWSLSACRTGTPSPRVRPLDAGSCAGSTSSAVPSRASATPHGAYRSG